MLYLLTKDIVGILCHSVNMSAKKSIFKFKHPQNTPVLFYN